MPPSTTLARVRLADTDARGNVQDTRFLELFEAARADAVREHDMPYALDQIGHPLPVGETHTQLSTQTWVVS